MIEKLNPKQKIAAQHIEGPLLVLAGAGSGKTRVVTCRIAHLLKIGVPSSEILALTFTNKAAHEMRSRIKMMADQYVLASTFHSLGARILRESIHTLGYRSDFTIYDDKDSLDLLKQCLALMGHKNDKELLKSVRISISNAKNSLLTPNHLTPSFSSRADQMLKEVFIAYQDKLKEYNALDFDDLLYLTVQLFRSSEETLKHYQKRWPFILIDEYQDTNAAQYLMTKLLVGTRNNIFVVGDPDQSIYSWRGANIHNILDFEKDYDNVQVITLEQNYRSTATILEGANGLIQHNEQRYEKRLWSDLGAGEKIGVYIAENEKEEAHFVVQELIRQTKKHKIPLKECVIFYRTNAQSRTFEDALLHYQVPYVIYGGLSFYQRREIKDILSLLRVTVSDSDYLAFARTINLPKRGIGNATLIRLQKGASDAALPILAFIQKLLEGKSSTVKRLSTGQFLEYERLAKQNQIALNDESHSQGAMGEEERESDEAGAAYRFQKLSCTKVKLTKRVYEGLSEYFKMINRLKGLTKGNKNLGEIVQAAIELSGYEKVLKEDPESYEDRKNNLEALINKAAEWSEDKEPPSLTSFLEELSLQSSLDDTPSYDAVHLMTLHNGKGLEFTLTFVVGLEEDLFPHINSKDSIEALEEERRLCYVGMTRAKQLLYLTASTYRFIWGIPKVMTPSRFLKEIPSHFLFPINPPIEEENSQWGEEEEGLQVGTLVFHKDFGKGVIEKKYTTSIGLTYDVKFIETQTVRSLVNRYAKFTVCNH